MIRQRDDAIKRGEVEGELDLLGLLLQCKEQSNNDLTMEDVIEECKLFYIAGQETTANLLTWTMICLSMHPNWQDKARQEVLDICGTTKPDFTTINQFKIVSSSVHTLSLPLILIIRTYALFSNRTCFVYSIIFFPYNFPSLIYI